MKDFKSSERGFPAGTWQSASGAIFCQLWQVQADGQIVRYEADVVRNGVITRTVTADNREQLLAKLKKITHGVKEELAGQS